MSLKIFLERPLASAGDMVVEDEFWTHYVTVVRRLQRGDNLEVVGTHQVAEATIAAVDPLTLELSGRRGRSMPDYRLWVVQSLTRKKKFEDVVRYGSEIGVTDFVPVLSERTVRRPNNPEKQGKRWKRIATDSTRITHRDWLPRIHPLTELTRVDSAVPSDGVICRGAAAGVSPGTCFSPEQTSVALVIGPEGGFTEEEKEFLDGTADSSVSLGSQNYRSETASIALSVIWLSTTGHLQPRVPDGS